jgi:NAD(P)-dependent dehydrogenase (short-subunit alcohol dehydrogenase family)
MQGFQGKVAIVTGGASGIGRALCEELCLRGARVVVADINLEEAQETAAAINATDGHAQAAKLDVCQAEAVQQLVENTSADYGRLDYMFNNAGVNVTGEVHDMRLEHWQRVIDVDLWGVIHGTTAAYPVMIRQGFGHIVNTSSLAGLVGLPTSTPYTAAKCAVVGLSTSLRVEAADLGVKVSVVCPGYVRTGIVGDALTTVGATREHVVRAIPFKLVDPRQAAKITIRGVARNRAIITYPSYGLISWWLWRLSPALVRRLQSKTVKDFRAGRVQS